MKEKTVLLDEAGERRALVRLAHEIIEHNKGTENLVLLGILTRGVPMSERIEKNIFEIEGVHLPVGQIDITHYRDDLTEITEMPLVKETVIPVNIKDKNVVLLDDVLFTGRTARAAMEAVLAVGRPKSIQLCVLIDRGHRELPIRADYVGKNIPTSLSEMVAVRFKETDGEDCIKLFDL